MTDETTNHNSSTCPTYRVEPGTGPSATPSPQGAENQSAENRQRAMAIRQQRDLNRSIESAWAQYTD